MEYYIRRLSGNINPNQSTFTGHIYIQSLSPDVDKTTSRWLRELETKYENFLIFVSDYQDHRHSRLLSNKVRIIKPLCVIIRSGIVFTCLYYDIIHSYTYEGRFSLIGKWLTSTFTQMCRVTSGSIDVVLRYTYVVGVHTTLRVNSEWTLLKNSMWNGLCPTVFSVWWFK